MGGAARGDGAAERVAGRLSSEKKAAHAPTIRKTVVGGTLWKLLI